MVEKRIKRLGKSTDLTLDFIAFHYFKQSFFIAEVEDGFSYMHSKLTFIFKFIKL